MVCPGASSVIRHPPRNTTTLATPKSDPSSYVCAYRYIYAAMFSRQRETQHQQPVLYRKFRFSTLCRGNNIPILLLFCCRSGMMNHGSSYVFLTVSTVRHTQAPRNDYRDPWSCRVDHKTLSGAASAVRQVAGGPCNIRRPYVLERHPAAGQVRCREGRVKNVPRLLTNFRSACSSSIITNHFRRLINLHIFRRHGSRRTGTDQAHQRPENE